MIVPEDLGIPLDLLDMSVYNTPPVQPPMAPEDEELLRDDEVLTPVKKDGIRKKERPTDKGMSWLVKTQYISPLSTDAAKMSITEKQAKERRESREGRNTFLENINDRYGFLLPSSLTLFCKPGLASDTTSLCICIPERSKLKPLRTPSGQLNHALFTRLNVGWKQNGFCLCFLILIGMMISLLW
jgi:hypothetical protein